MFSRFFKTVVLFGCLLMIAPALAEAKTFYRNVSPMDMAPRNNEQLFSRTSQLIITDFSSPANAFYYYHAQLHFPDGASLKTLTVWLDDTSLSQNLSVRFERTQVEGNNSQDICTVDSSQVNTTQTSISCTPSALTATVDNENYRYSLELTLPPNEFNALKFRSAQIRYEASPGAVVIPLN